MKPPFISRRRHEAELAAVKAERDRAGKEGEAAQIEVATTAAYFAAANSVIACLERDLAEARTKLAASQDAESALARQIHAMAQPVEPTDEEVDEINRLIRERDSEKRRADRLQKELDDATFLPAGKVENSVRWQPGYQDPKQDTA